MTFIIDNPRGVATTPLRKICLGKKKTLRITRVKDKCALDYKTCLKIYPTVADVPKFNGLIKIHKADYPIKISWRRFIAGIISPLITNAQFFVEKIHDLKLEPDESIVSFDVSALFTSIPVKEALEVVTEFLERDDS